MLTVYHGGYMPVIKPEIRVGRKILAMVFIVRLSKNKPSAGRKGMTIKLCRFMMFVWIYN